MFDFGCNNIFWDNRGHRHSRWITRSAPTTQVLDKESNLDTRINYLTNISPIVIRHHRRFHFAHHQRNVPQVWSFLKSSITVRTGCVYKRTPDLYTLWDGVVVDHLEQTNIILKLFLGITKDSTCDSHWDREI